MGEYITCLSHFIGMDIFNFIASVVLITLSGALAPGPLFFATISYGTVSGAKSGLLFSIAHSIVEFTLVLLLAFSLVTVTSEPMVKLSIGIIGGIVLVIFGVLQIRSALKFRSYDSTFKQVKTRNLFLIGLMFTGLNPLFIIWWLTVGANLILQSLQFASLPGVVLMYVCHVWLDYVWLVLVAYLARMGTNLLGLKQYKVVMAFFGAILIYFGIIFLFDSLGPYA